MKQYGIPVFFLTVAAVVFCVSWGERNSADAQNGGSSSVPSGFSNYSPGSSAASTAVIPRPLEVPEVYVFDRPLEDGQMQVVVVDSEQKRICVYHIDTAGQIEFVANRNYEWDLKFIDFNGKGLTPAEIRDAVEKSVEIQ